MATGGKQVEPYFGGNSEIIGILHFPLKVLLLGSCNLCVVMDHTVTLNTPFDIELDQGQGHHFQGQTRHFQLYSV